MPLVEMTLMGRKYSNFSKIFIRRSLEEFTHYFEIEMAIDASMFRLEDGTLISAKHEEVLIDFADRRLLTGWIDIVERIVREGERYVSLKGRSKTRNLVDCPLTINANNLTLKELADQAGKLVGVKVAKRSVQGKPVREFAIQAEPPFEPLSVIARQQGLMCSTDSYGNLFIIQPGDWEVGANLVLGQNVREYKETQDGRNEFSRYVVKGGPDDEGQVENPRITNQLRPWEAISDKDYASLSCQALAEDEHRKRMGISCTVKLQGWGYGVDNAPWVEGCRVRLIAENLQGINDNYVPIRATMVVSSVEYTVNSKDGMISLIKLRPMEAYR
ncbi:MAG: hypothetical protein B6D68_02510 [spirochete symbiont of Stewartia floridana]|nr:MAG: hypothetical protein B6D68_02510 [spirochete symbiont of Stewartia floridana]